MTNATTRLNASIGDLETTVADSIAVIQAAANSQPGTDDATVNAFADRVDAVNKQLNDALAPVVPVAK